MNIYTFMYKKILESSRTWPKQSRTEQIQTISKFLVQWKILSNSEICQTYSKPIPAPAEPLSLTLSADNEEMEKMEAKLTLSQRVKSVCMGTWRDCPSPINKII